MSSHDKTQLIAALSRFRSSDQAGYRKLTTNAATMVRLHGEKESDEFKGTEQEFLQSLTQQLRQLLPQDPMLAAIDVFEVTVLHP